MKQSKQSLMLLIAGLLVVIVVLLGVLVFASLSQLNAGRSSSDLKSVKVVLPGSASAEKVKRPPSAEKVEYKRVEPPAVQWDDEMMQVVLQWDMWEQLPARAAQAGFDKPPAKPVDPLDPKATMNGEKKPFQYTSMQEVDTNKEQRSASDAGGKRKRRSAPTQNSLSSPGLIAFDQQNSSTMQYYAYQYVLTSLNQYVTNYALYPYSFSYTQGSTYNFNQGAAIALKPSLPSDPTQYNYFNSLTATSTVNFGRAKALYDINIAILSVPGFYNNIYMDLLYESSTYCNILSSYLGKFTTCLQGSSGYYSFISSATNAGKTAAVYVTPTDLSSTTNFLLTSSGDPLFQLLILPDHFTGSAASITSNLGTNGVNNLVAYVNAGGQVFASGKSGYLLQTWGILPNNLYLTSSVIQSTSTNSQEKILGCTQNTDFFSTLLCMNVNQTSATYGYSYVSSSYLVNTTVWSQAVGSAIRQVATYDSSSATLMKNVGGFIQALSTNDKSALPFAFLANYGKGQMMVVNGNPLFKSGFNQMFYNALFVAMSKNVAFDTFVVTKNNLPIPGGEANILVSIQLNFLNLYSTSVSDVSVHVWFPNAVVSAGYNSTCAPDPTQPSFAVNLTSVNASSHITCTGGTVPGFGSYGVVINAMITSYTVTQPKYNILLALPAIAYVDTTSGQAIHDVDVGGVLTNALAAAYLQGDLNPDPSSFYPIMGRGQYVDNVLQLQNKEETQAIDVDYVAVVPLISPVVDGSNQAATALMSEFLPSYYTMNGRYWYYPFENQVDQNYDFLDFAWLNGRNVVLGAEWEIPVKPVKVLRNYTTFPAANFSGNFDIINMNYSMSVNTPDLVTEQIYFTDSSQFFEHATQRLMTYVDTTQPAGAATLYPSGVPAAIQNPFNAAVTKKHLVWVRNDVYFYANASLYQNPNNFPLNYVVTVDAYSPTYSGACASKFGAARAKILVPGYFNISYPDGLKPNEYSNELLMNCGLQGVSPADAQTYSGGSIKPVHYLVPVIDPDIKRADNLLNWTANADGTGYLNGYSSLKFVYGHSMALAVSPNITRQGGKFEIVLPAGVAFKNAVDPIANGYITYSADQVAFYQTNYSAATNTITSYFKRGLQPNEAYGEDSQLQVMIEQLNIAANTSATLKVYGMNYDLSNPGGNYEDYALESSFTLPLVYGSFYSLPAVEMHIKLNRSNGNTQMLPYEMMQPYARFGVYIQELLNHRTVYASPEVHNPRDPGMVGINGGFSTISNVGESSIPFRQYVMTGSGLLIPSAPTTSRVEWSDIWGRRWVQPLRSVFPDVPPIPPPLRNFEMTSTFELTKANSTERVMSWTSDQNLDIRVQIKLVNNYPKYFEITTCHDNNVSFWQKQETMFQYSRIFDVPPFSYAITPTSTPNDVGQYHVNFGSRDVYGMCFDQTGTILQGQTITQDQMNIINSAYLCLNDANATAVLICQQHQNSLNIPVVAMCPSGSSKTGADWMYSPEIAAYYPTNYIKSNMWDMTHYDYDDNAFDKAYKYHMDNNLPGIDYGPPQNPARYQPHNLINQPIYKGLGFSITYSNQKTLARFPKYKGWWSDNLQNRDTTLLAGQTQSNDISVNADTLLPDAMWVNAHDLKNYGATDTVALGRLKNIYSCLFNQYRIKMSVNQQVYAYPANVYQNNIVPVDPTLTKYDSRLSAYDCSNVFQYTPFNISQFNNIVSTPTIRDYLYFAANLRGGALEAVNVPYSLAPISGTLYEGLAKVNDGASFVYWNPANGPNSFLTVGDAVNLVEAVRCDLNITATVLPAQTTTFDAVVYHYFNVSDPAEINRQWTYQTYTNGYGYGDSTVTVFVGGQEATYATISAGQTTYATITFYNNAGFDWNMYASAIDFVNLGTAAINANDLLTETVHTIQKPISYNFMLLSIPAELAPYVNITPAVNNLEVAPMFFDFQSINVVTIRDGFEGQFNYQITLANSLPSSIQGRVWEIPIKLNYSCFDKLPGYNDPTGSSYHDYTLEVPSIKFGIPYASGSNQGKVFYTSGYSHALQLMASVPSNWALSDARLLTDAQVSALRLATGDLQTAQTNMAAIWNTLNQSIPVTVTSQGTNGMSTMSIDLSGAFPTFPLPLSGGGPDQAALNLVVRATSSQLPYGTIRVISSPTIYYTDFTNRTKSTLIPTPTDLTVASAGPWLLVSYSTAVMYRTGAGSYSSAPDQRVFASDQGGYVQITVTAKNVGNAPAYNVNLTLFLQQNIQLMTDALPANTTAGTNSSVVNAAAITLSPGDAYAVNFYVYFSMSSSLQVYTSSNATVPIVSSASSAMTQSQSASTKVVQTISQPLAITVNQGTKDVVSLTASAVSTSIASVTNTTCVVPLVTLVATPTPTTESGYAIRYSLLRTITALTCTNDAASPATGTCSNITLNSATLVQYVGAAATITDEPINSNFTGTVTSVSLTYMVITYDYWMNQLATATTSITWSATTSSGNQNQNDNSNNNQGEQSSSSTKQSSSTTQGLSLPVYAIVLISVAGLVIVVGVVGALVFGAVKLVFFMQTSGSTAATVGSSAGSTVPLTQSIA